MAETLELIGYGHHVDKHGDLYTDWDPVNHTKAQQTLASIASLSS